MKEFKLLGWPELPSSYAEVSYTRALNELSQRFVSEEELHRVTGIPVPEVRALLKFLATEDLLDGRETAAPALAHAPAPKHWLDWLKRFR